MRSFSGKIPIVLLSVFLLIYVGYQLWGFIDNPYKTEIAMRYSVSETIRVNGIAVRTEEPVYSEDAGSISYNCEDAAKVLKGSCIAYTHASKDTVENGRKADALQREIDLLKEANTISEQGYGTTELLNKQIGDAMIDISEISDESVLENVEGVRDDLLLLLNKKQILIGEETGYDNRITQLQNQRAVLLNRISSDSEMAVLSPSSGYFVSAMDGYEELINKESLFEMSVLAIEKLLTSEHKFEGTAIGKLADNYKWYYAASVSQEDEEKLNIGGIYNIVFDGMSETEIEMTLVDILSDDSSEGRIAIFESDIFTPDTATIRKNGAEIILSNFSGIRVSNEAVRYVNTASSKEPERGVYILDRGTVKFKKIDVIYEGTGYKLCRWKQGVPDSLQIYDEVFVRGADLYDGKAVE